MVNFYSCCIYTHNIPSLLTLYNFKQINPHLPIYGKNRDNFREKTCFSKALLCVLDSSAGHCLSRVCFYV